MCVKARFDTVSWLGICQSGTYATVGPIILSVALASETVL
jgi:hypothetical protein